MSDRCAVALLFVGGVLGGWAGWLIAPVLIPDESFAGALAAATVPVAAFIGLLVAYLLARWLSRFFEAKNGSGGA